MNTIRYTLAIKKEEIEPEDGRTIRSGLHAISYYGPYGDPFGALAGKVHEIFTEAERKFDEDKRNSVHSV